MKIGTTRARVATLLVTAAGIAVLVAGVAGSVGSAQAASGRQAIPHTQPSWLAHATKLGHASPGAAVQARVYLAPNGGLAQLKQFALAVSTPGSAQYRHFLTPSRYFQRFGTTASTVAAVKSWLTGSGLHVAILNTTLRTIGRPEELRDRLFAKTVTVALAEALEQPDRVFPGLPGVEAWRAVGVRTVIVVPSSAKGNQMVAFEELFAAYR